MSFALSSTNTMFFFAGYVSTEHSVSVYIQLKLKVLENVSA